MKNKLIILSFSGFLGLSGMDKTQITTLDNALITARDTAKLVVHCSRVDNNMLKESKNALEKSIKDDKQKKYHYVLTDHYVYELAQQNNGKVNKWVSCLMTEMPPHNKKNYGIAIYNVSKESIICPEIWEKNILFFQGCGLRIIFNSNNEEFEAFMRKSANSSVVFCNEREASIVNPETKKELKSFWNRHSQKICFVGGISILALLVFMGSKFIASN